MQPEIMSQLIQFGALGLLAAVLWFVMQQQFSLLKMLADTLKALVDQISALQKTMLNALLDAKDESVIMAKSLSLMTTPTNGGGEKYPNNKPN